MSFLSLNIHPSLSVTPEQRFVHVNVYNASGREEWDQLEADDAQVSEQSASSGAF